MSYSSKLKSQSKNKRIKGGAGLHRDGEGNHGEYAYAGANMGDKRERVGLYELFRRGFGFSKAPLSNGKDAVGGALGRGGAALDASEDVPRVNVSVPTNLTEIGCGASKTAYRYSPNPRRTKRKRSNSNKRPEFVIKAIKPSKQSNIVKCKFNTDLYQEEILFTDILSKRTKGYVLGNEKYTEANRNLLKPEMYAFKHKHLKIPLLQSKQKMGIVYSSKSKDVSQKTEFLKFIIDHALTRLKGSTRQVSFLDNKPANSANVEGKPLIIDASPEFLHLVIESLEEHYRIIIKV